MHQNCGCTCTHTGYDRHLYQRAIIGQSDVITIKVSSLPLDTTMDEIGHYLESEGDNVKVLSVSNLGNGNAEVKVIGYTIKGQLASLYNSFQ